MLDIDHLSKTELCAYIHKQMLRFGSLDVMIKADRLKEVNLCYLLTTATDKSQM